MAEEINREVIINVTVSSTEAIRNIAEAKRQIDELKQKNKELAQSQDDESEAIARNTEQIKALNKVVAANSKEVQTNIARQKEQDGSLKQMRADLKALTDQYDSLSAAERNSAKGTELLAKIQQTTAELNSAEQASGRFQRNVGNYPGILGKLGSTVQMFSNQIMVLTRGATTLQGGFKGLIMTVVQFGKALVALMAIPIVALLAAIAAVVMMLVKAIKKNDDALTGMQKALAALQPIVSLLNQVLGVLAEVVAKVTQATTWLTTAIFKLIPAFREAQDAAEKLVEAEDQLEEAERDYTVAHAEREREISRLREEAADKENYTFEQRKKNIQQAMLLEKEDLEQAKANAAERYRIEKEKAEQDNDTSDETKNRLAELQAAAINAETQYYTSMRKLQREYNTFLEEERRNAEQLKKDEEEKAKQAAADYKAALQARRQARDKELAEQRKAADMAWAMIQDVRLREEIILKASYMRMKEDLQRRLKEEEGLTKAAREAINQQIVLLDAELQLKLAELAEKYSADEIERLREEYRQKLELFEGNEEATYNIQRDWLERERDLAVVEAEKSGEDIEKVRLLYAKRLQNLDDQRAREREQSERRWAELELRQMQNDFERQMQQTTTTEAGKLAIQQQYAEERLAALQEEYDRRRMMSDEDAIAAYGSIEQWRAAVLDADAEVIAANREVVMSQQAVAEYQAAQADAIGQSFVKVGGSIQGIFDTLAETDERYADFATGMALANIITSSAISIASAIQAATQAGAFTGAAAPATIPIFIAELTSIVAAGITSAITTLNKARQARSEAKYAEGGYVDGPGTSTSDSIPARLSKGEFVVNAKGTRDNLPLLVAMNGGWGNTGGRRFASGGVVGMETMLADARSETFRAAVREAVADIQPMVSVKEITRVQNRVTAKENISKY